MTKVNAGHLLIYLRARKKAETRAKNRKEAAVAMQAGKGRRQGRGGTEKTAGREGGREGTARRKGTARPNLAARTQAGENMTHGRRRGKTRRTDAGGKNTTHGRRRGKHDTWTGKEEMDGEVGKKGGEALIIIKYGWLGDDYGGVYVSYFKKLY